MKKHKFISITACIIALLIVFGVKLVNNRQYQSTSFAMGTVINQVVYGKNGEQIIKKVQDEINYLEINELTKLEGEGEINSQIYNINNNYIPGESFEISESMSKYLKEILELAEASNGALDPTVGKLSSLWNIGAGGTTVPSQDKIEEALKTVGYQQVSINNNTIIIDNFGINLDLGAVGKGIACDEIKDILDENKVKGAVIAVGGSLLVYGEKTYDQPWKIAIADPREEGENALILEVEETSFISTSGDYEKYFFNNNIRYHHILNPYTGYPTDNEIMSVTIICDSGLSSDGLSTACFVLGIDGSIELLNKYNAQAIFITKDKKIYITKNIASSITLTNDQYTIVDDYIGD